MDHARLFLLSRLHVIAFQRYHRPAVLEYVLLGVRYYIAVSCKGAFTGYRVNSELIGPSL